MSNSIVEDVLLSPVIAEGIVEAAVGLAAVAGQVAIDAAVGAGKLAIGGVVLAADLSVTLAKDFGSGVTDVLAQMQAENQERLKLEQEFMQQIKEEREKAFNNINAYVANLIKLSETDTRLEKLNSVSGGSEMVQSFIRKREEKAEKIRQLREKAIRSRDVEEIETYVKAAEAIYDSLSDDIQEELFFFGKNGIKMSEYGTMHEDAVKMALTERHEISQIRQHFTSDEVVVTEAMLRHDILVFENCLSEFLCEDGLNDRQLRDILAIRTDLLKISKDASLKPEIKKKRVATLFSTYERRQKAISAELKEMADYYELYLLETFDIPDERLELADFDSIDEIASVTAEARKAREERAKMQYVQIQMDRVMKKHGLNVVESAVMGRKEDDKRVLYGIDESAAVDVFISEKGTVTTHVVGINFGDTPTDAEEDALVEKEKKFCSKMAQIEADLEDLGIHLRRKRTVPPGKEYSSWVQIDKTVQVNRDKIRRRKKKRGGGNDKVRYIDGADN